METDAQIVRVTRSIDLPPGPIRRVA